jgi:cytoskeletal protein RodZ
LKNKDISQDSGQMIGARLAARRSQAGIAIEKVAKDLRVSVERMRAIESDDFSGFAHSTYARLFLLDYANYLRVPVEDIKPYLPGAGGMGSGENKYLDVLIANNGFLKGDQFKSIRLLLTGLGAGLSIVLLVILGIYSWRFWEKFERVKKVNATSAKATLKAEAKPTPKRVSTPLPPAPPTSSAASTSTPMEPFPSASPSATPFTMPPFKPAPIPKRTP